MECANLYFETMELFMIKIVQIIVSSLSIIIAANPASADARSDLLAMYDQGCLAVSLPDPHGQIMAADFREHLITHPDFASKVDVIALEFASAFHQDLLDRWVLEGEDIPLSETRKIWRDTLSLFVWDSPLYESFFIALREANLALPREHRVRALALAPAIDWANAESHDDIAPYMERGRLMPERIHTEALSNGQTVLIIMGSSHYIRRGYFGRRGGGSAYLDRRYPDQLCVIAQVNAEHGNAERFAISHNFKANVPRLIYPITGSDFEGIRSDQIMGAEARGKIEQAADAILYLGNDGTGSYPDFDIYDSSYRSELSRRVPLIWPGSDGDEFVEDTLARTMRWKEGLPE